LEPELELGSGTKNETKIFENCFFFGEKSLGPAMNQCWVVLTFLRSVGSCFWGQVLRTAMVFLKKFSHSENRLSFQNKKNPVRQFSQIMVFCLWHAASTRGQSVLHDLPSI
jgi:hypothetical protein